MISIMNNLKHLDEKELSDVVGVYYKKSKCSGEKCKREDHQQNGVCEWLDEVILTDRLQYQVKGQYNKMEDREVQIPVRYYNFMVALSNISANNPLLTEPEKINKSLKHAKMNCFGLDGKPENMAEKLGFSSYNMLLQSLNQKL